jgi:hypothetical protein
MVKGAPNQPSNTSLRFPSTHHENKVQTSMLNFPRLP